MLHLQSFQVKGPQNREISLFLRNKIGRFLRELLGNLINPTQWLAHGSHSALFTLYFGIASQSDVVKLGDDNDMPLLYWNGHNLFVHQLWEFICEGLCPGVHVTSDVITYHCSACRRRGTIERRLTLLRNNWRDCYLNIVVPLEYV